MRTALGWRLLLVVAAVLFTSDAFASKRVALVIGNSAYQHVGKLPNPPGDANAIAKLLTDVGFDRVEQRNDLSISAFRRAIREFAEISRGADLALVFYAGHGMEVGGSNYLIPTDAKLTTDLDIDDEVMPLDRVLRSLEAARTRLVILDACRDNPFLSQMSRLAGTRSVGRGLARIEPNGSDMLIAFAAKAGSIAADGVTGNSPFTTALIKHVAEPGLDIRLALGKVRDDVLMSTNGRQEPFVYGSLGGNTVAISPAAATAPQPSATTPVAAAPVDPAVAMRRDYELAERVGSKDAWNLFMVRYPSGFYADLARAQVAKLAAAAAPVAAAIPASPVVVAMADPKPQLEAPATVTRIMPTATPSPIAAAPHSEPDLVVISANPGLKSSSEPATPPAASNAGASTAGTGPSGQKQASLTVPSVEAPTEPRKSIVLETIRTLQIELKRVGCDPGGDLGLWEDGSKRALEKFNRYAGTQLSVNMASIAAMEAVQSKKDRVCPMECKAGYHADGDHCVRGRSSKRRS